MGNQGANIGFQTEYVIFVTKWYKKAKKAFKFTVLMVYMETAWNHFIYCYFCNIHVSGYNSKNKKTIFPKVTSADRPLRYGTEIAVRMQSQYIDNILQSTPEYKHIFSSFCCLEKIGTL